MKQETEIFTQYLSNNCLKNTSQRMQLLDVFLKQKKHLTVEELYVLIKKKDPLIGQTTVYRTLKLIVESGLGEEVDFGDGLSRYEPTVGRSHHDHMFCRQCKKPFEVVDDEIEKLQERLAKKHGFELEGHKLILYGSCASCIEKASKT